MSTKPEIATAASSLSDLDVSLPEHYEKDTWRPMFATLRKEAPVHYLSDSVNGPFWSVTSHALIKEVDANNSVFFLGKRWNLDCGSQACGGTGTGQEFYCDGRT